jgi:hypothetical protein
MAKSGFCLSNPGERGLSAFPLRGKVWLLPLGLGWNCFLKKGFQSLYRPKLVFEFGQKSSFFSSRFIFLFSSLGQHFSVYLNEFPHEWREEKTTKKGRSSDALTTEI